MTGAIPSSLESAPPQDLQLVTPRNSPAQAMHNVDQRLTDLQVGQSELHLRVAQLANTVESAKLHEMSVKIDQLIRAVESAKLAELGVKVDGLIKSVDGAKLPDMSYKIDGLTKTVDTAKLPEMSARLETTSSSLASVKTKVDDLNNVKAMVVGGFTVLTVMLGLIGWILKNGFDYYSSHQIKPEQSHSAPATVQPNTAAEPPAATRSAKPAIRRPAQPGTQNTPS